jgi:hypothetical protein
MLPVLRGFSRNVKQDSEASNASGGMETMQPAVSPYLWQSGRSKKKFQNVAERTYFLKKQAYNMF